MMKINRFMVGLGLLLVLFLSSTTAHFETGLECDADSDCESITPESTCVLWEPAYVGVGADKYCLHHNYKFYDNNGLQFLYTLYLIGTLQSDKTCQPYQTWISGKGHSIEKGQQLDLSFPPVAGGNMALREQGDYVCAWKDLPLNKKGCYFLVEEEDRVTGCGSWSTITASIDDDWCPNDCAGWFVPPGIPLSGTISNAKSVFFGDDANAVVANSLPVKVGEPVSKYRVSGQHSDPPKYSDMLGPRCVFSSSGFTLSNEAYVCLPQEDEYRWYVCNEELSKTGNYIPSPSEPVTCDEGTKDECAEKAPDECVDAEGKNICSCNEESKCTKAGEVLGEGAPQAWFCEQDAEGTFIWDEKPLRCTNAGIDCDQNQKICEGDDYSWLPTSGEQGICCGDDGLSDFAKRTFSTAGGGDNLCLNRELVGHAGTGDPPGWDTQRCPGDWCWILASNQNSAFKVFTLKPPLQQPYDLVSNSQNWLGCDENTAEGTQDLSLGLTDPSFRENANRFYCYQEGEHGSWADCVEGEPRPLADTDVNGVKTRLVGDGLFALPVKSSTTPTSVAVDLDKLKSFYDNPLLDIVNYDTLEFYVKFTKDIIPPADVTLIIRGPQQAGTPLEYFHQKVLGYAIGNPVLEKDRWIHVQVPLPASGWYGVSSIELQSEPADNEIIVRNIYLSKTGKTQFCSGEKSDREGQSAWLDGLDFYGSSRWNAQALCNTLFDPQVSDPVAGRAWLGKDVLGERKCCGDDPAEYYAGPTDEGKDSGCWNSQPIGKGETTMNVEANVEYREPSSPEVHYPLDLTYELTTEYGFTERTAAINFGQAAEPVSLTYSGKHSYSSSISIITPLVRKIKISDIIKEISSVDIPSTESPETLSDDEHQISPRIRISHTESAVGGIVGIVKDKFQLTKIRVSITQGLATVSFLNTVTGDFIDAITAEDLERYGKDSFQLVAKTEAIGGIVETVIVGAPQPNTEVNPIFSCSSDECLFPLPGQPPYKITNPRPELYELYFVTGPKLEDEIPITSSGQQFDSLGNLKAKKVAQQVVFVNTLADDKESNPQAKFYGCQAASFIKSGLTADFLQSNDGGYEEVNYCTNKAERFCSPSVPHPGKTAEQKGYTTINSWSTRAGEEPDMSLEKVGYKPEKDTDQRTPADFYNNIQLQLREATAEEKDAKKTPLNYSASVLPARNFLSNAQFDNIGTELPHWTIIDGNGLELSNEKSRVESSLVSLLPGEKLRSERIAIPQEAELAFTQTSDCNVQIKLVDKDGKKKIVPSNSVLSILTEKNSYALIEFTGPCDIQQPMLQVVDELGAAAYHELVTGLEDDARTGLSCCPQNYCWNGYACIEPMGSFTYLAEHVTEGRDYRCLNGEWSYMPVRRDWNNDNWGFCEQNEQCLVMSSSGGASPQSKAADFYNLATAEGVTNPPPTCINNNEYIFDHYCQQGNWSSRTKFIATKLLEVAGEEYTLYCTSYREALLSSSNQGDKDLYLSGELAGAASAAPGFAEAATGGQAEQPPPQLKKCFDLQGRSNLVPDEENTCINNVCLLKDEDGKVSFATSLNKNATDDDPFFLALNIPPAQVNEICQGEGEFIECDLGGLDIDGDLWYSKELNAIVYGKDGISLEPGLIDKIIDWFQNLFGINSGSAPSEEQQFVQQAQNFRELYISTEGGRKVRAMQEIFPDTKALVAEFEDFDSSVCDYIDNLQKPTSTELLEEVTGQTPISCSQIENRQRLEAFTDLEFLWPQLSGMLRVG